MRNCDAEQRRRQSATGALGEGLFEGFLAGVEAEAANVELATAAAAAAAAAVTATVTSTRGITVTSTRSITVTSTRGRTALLARGAAGTLPATFVSLGHCGCCGRFVLASVSK